MQPRLGMTSRSPGKTLFVSDIKMDEDEVLRLDIGTLAPQSLKPSCSSPLASGVKSWLDDARARQHDVRIGAHVYKLPGPVHHHIHLHGMLQTGRPPDSASVPHARMRREGAPRMRALELHTTPVSRSQMSGDTVPRMGKMGCIEPSMGRN